MRRCEHRGFTLIELMVTIAVLTILLVIAVPSFMSFRERVSLRGAGDQMVSFWTNAKLESVKRDVPVTVSIRTTGTTMCMGASTTGAVCTCFATAALTTCNVAQYPQSTSQTDWRGVTVVGTPGDTIATIDPKRGNLSGATAVVGPTLQSPGSRKFRLKFYADRWARPSLCAPTDSPLILSDYSTRTCAP